MKNSGLRLAWLIDISNPPRMGGITMLPLYLAYALVGVVAMAVILLFKLLVFAIKTVAIVLLWVITTLFGRRTNAR